MAELGSQELYREVLDWLLAAAYAVDRAKPSAKTEGGEKVEGDNH
jgi:hypothetical protein